MQNFPIHDGFFEQFIQSEEPRVYDYKKIIDAPNAPLYAKIHYDVGLREVISIPMFDEKEIWGVLHFYSNRYGSWNADSLSIIKGVASQISVAISNIEASEKLINREKEQHTLLSLSHQMAKIRDKNQLLSLINTQLKKLFDFSHSSISVIAEDRQTFSVYLTDPQSRSRQHQDYEKLVVSTYPVNDGVFNIFMEATEPIISDYEDVQRMDSPPPYAVIHYQVGMREAVSVPLPGEKEIWGILHFYSDCKGTFNPLHFNIIKGVASQVAVAVANIIANENIHSREMEKEMLLSISYDLGNIRNKNELLTFINTRLKNIFYFTHSSIAALNDDKKTFTVYLTDPHSRSRDHPEYMEMITTKYLVKDSVFDTILNSSEPTVSDIEKNAKLPNAPHYSKVHYEAGLREAVSIPLQGEKRTFGVITFYSDVKNCFNTNTMNIIRGVASQVAIAVSNILAHEDVRQREKEKTLLLSFSHDIASVRDKKSLGEVINSYLKNRFLVKEYIISLKNIDQRTTSYFLYDQNAQYVSQPEFTNIRDAKIPITGGMAEVVFKANEPVNFDLRMLEKGSMVSSPTAQFWRSLNIMDILGVPLKVGNQDIGVLWTQPDQLNDHLIKGLAAQIAIALANTIANERIENQLKEISTYKLRLEEENQYLQQEIVGNYNHSEIIGGGAEMQKIFHLLSQVSNSSSTVLVLGETGTGKELIARAIHNASTRKDKIMVKVNCAALPANLIESELFGHEKGSFTGATERRIGKFELANNSTLFLDEIGEMPLDLQVKLLRALQEREIERVGGKSTLKVDVRIIAATNRNLQKEVDAGRFRSDLFYRLNVFPIILPSLRDRKEDIPVLVSHFIARYAKNSGKHISNLSHKVLQDLMAYSWPGNIRELEHLVERSVLLTNGTTIKEMHLPIRERGERLSLLDGLVFKTLSENERDHILQAIKKCKGKVSGIGGAAELLGLPYSTLTSKMAKLGIRKEHFITS